MKSKSKFTVKIPSEIYKGEVFITAFFIVLNVMYTICLLYTSDAADEL